MGLAIDLEAFARDDHVALIGQVELRERPVEPLKLMRRVDVRGEQAAPEPARS